MTPEQRELCGRMAYRVYLKGLCVGDYDPQELSDGTWGSFPEKMREEFRVIGVKAYEDLTRELYPPVSGSIISVAMLHSSGITTNSVLPEIRELAEDWASVPLVVEGDAVE